MKVVVDVNVLVSGSLWRGSPSILVDAILDGTATLCVSPAILEEFEEVLHRPKFLKRLETYGRGASEIISQFRATALIVESGTIARPAALRDPEDIHVLRHRLPRGRHSDRRRRSYFSSGV